MRRVLPNGALPVREGQVWKDRDKRSPTLVRVILVSLSADPRVWYDRGVITTSSLLDNFTKRFDWISNPEPLNHTEHGLGTDPDCPCRTTEHQRVCDGFGCGYCRAAVDAEC
jgi:hypothetical protein